MNNTKKLILALSVGCCVGIVVAETPTYWTNATGEVVAKVDKARARSVLSADFPATDKNELWCLKADNFVDDGGVRIGGDAIPVVSPCPECAFVYEENKGIR